MINRLTAGKHYVNGINIGSSVIKRLMKRVIHIIVLNADLTLFFIKYNKLFYLITLF